MAQMIAYIAFSELLYYLWLYWPLIGGLVLLYVVSLAVFAVRSKTWKV